MTFLYNITRIFLIGAVITFIGSQYSVVINGFPLFAICAATAFAVQWIVFVPSYLLQTEHYYDLTGSITYILVTSLALYLGQASSVQIALGTLICLWAMRLGSFLFWRVKKQGKDSRFDGKKEQFSWFFTAWTMQGLWVLFTSAAALAAMTTQLDASWNWVTTIGLTIWLFGFSTEVVSDYQKTKFRSVPANKDRFITSGLWKYSRHPNYFGEITLWFGIAIMALPSLSGWQYGCLISPFFVWYLLQHISGVAMLDPMAQERWGDDPEFQQYTKKTPTIFPRVWK